MKTNCIYSGDKSAAELLKKMGAKIEHKSVVLIGETFKKGCFSRITKYFFTDKDGNKSHLIETCHDGNGVDYFLYFNKSRFGEMRAIVGSGICKPIIKRDLENICSRLDMGSSK